MSRCAKNQLKANDLVLGGQWFFDLRFAVSASLTIDPKPWQNAGMHKTGAFHYLLAACC